MSIFVDKIIDMFAIYKHFYKMLADKNVSKNIGIYVSKIIAISVR